MTTMREPTERHRAHVEMVRNVWACLTTHPNATLDEMVTLTGIAQTQVQLALIELERIGYVRRTARTARSAVVVVPLIERTR